MTRYWLSPVASVDPCVLHPDRIVLSAEEGESLRCEMAKVHPRLLPSFKLSLFVGGDGEACGSGPEAAELRLDIPGEIVLEGALQVSHCGLAFLDRLLAAEEACRLLNGVGDAEQGSLPIIRSWLDQGYPVILLKEE